MKRLIFIIAAIAGATLIGADSSLAAREQPWCVKANIGVGAAIDICHFRTFEECREARFYYFSTAFCVHNPRYLPYWTTGEPPPSRKARRKLDQ